MESHLSRFLEAEQKRFNQYLSQSVESEMVSWLTGRDEPPANSAPAPGSPAPDSRNQDISARFGEILGYCLASPGKRLRPVLVALGFRLWSGPPESEQGFSEAAAADLARLQLAVESLHSYSLVHDDLPTMDNDTLRRGRPTAHVAWGEANALLAGDALNSLAFYLVATTELAGEKAEAKFSLSKLLVSILHLGGGAAGMVLGQFADLDSEKNPVGEGEFSGAEELLRFIHNRKTGALISASFQLGYALGAWYAGQLEEPFSLGQSPAVGLFGGTPGGGPGSEHWLQSDLRSWGEWARELGLSFQIRDDLLDVEGVSQALGKSSGKDARDEKLTYVRLYGAAEVRRILEKREARLIAKIGDLSRGRDYNPQTLSILKELVTYFGRREK